MADADGTIIPFTEDDQGEGIKDFIDKITKNDLINEGSVHDRIFGTEVLKLRKRRIINGQ